MNDKIPGPPTRPDRPPRPAQHDGEQSPSRPWQAPDWEMTVHWVRSVLGGDSIEPRQAGPRDHSGDAGKV